MSATIPEPERANLRMRYFDYYCEDEGKRTPENLIVVGGSILFILTVLSSFTVNFDVRTSEELKRVA